MSFICHACFSYDTQRNDWRMESKRVRWSCTCSMKTTVLLYRGVWVTEARELSLEGYWVRKEEKPVDWRRVGGQTRVGVGFKIFRKRNWGILVIHERWRQLGEMWSLIWCLGCLNRWLVDSWAFNEKNKSGAFWWKVFRFSALLGALSLGGNALSWPQTPPNPACNSRIRHCLLLDFHFQVHKMGTTLSQSKKWLRK